MAAASEKAKTKHADSLDEQISEIDIKELRTGLGRRVWTCFLLCFFGCFNMGMNMALVASTLQKTEFITYMGLDTASNAATLIGTIVAMSWLGGGIGTLINSHVCDHFGRKAGFYFAILLAFLGGALSAGARNLTMFIFGRFFSGASGWASMLPAIIYLQEVAPTHYRGDLGSLIGPSINVGWVTCSWIQVGFAYLLTANAWRWPMILQFTPSVMMLCVLPFVPESPRWHAFKGRNEKALEIFKYLHQDAHDPDDVLAKEEMYQVGRQVVIDRSLPSSWYAMFTRYWRRSGASILVVFDQTMMGPQVVAQYGVSLYTQSGVSPQTAIIIQACWYVACLVFSAFWSRFVDKWGRKPMLIWGTVVVLPVYAVITALYAEFIQYAADKSPSTLAAGQKTLIGFFFIYIFLFQIQEPACYVYIGEIYSSHLRAKGCAIGLAATCFSTFWLTYCFPIGTASQGWRFFLLNIVLMAVCIVLMWFWLKESRGLTLEEMAVIWGNSEEVAVFSKDIKRADVEAEFGLAPPKA